MSERVRAALAAIRKPGPVEVAERILRMRRATRAERYEQMVAAGAMSRSNNATEAKTGEQLRANLAAEVDELDAGIDALRADLQRHRADWNPDVNESLGPLRIEIAVAVRELTEKLIDLGIAVRAVDDFGMRNALSLPTMPQGIDENIPAARWAHRILTEAGHVRAVDVKAAAE